MFPVPRSAYASAREPAAIESPVIGAGDFVAWVGAIVLERPMSGLEAAMSGLEAALIFEIMMTLSNCRFIRSYQAMSELFLGASRLVKAGVTCMHGIAELSL